MYDTNLLTEALDTFGLEHFLYVKRAESLSVSLEGVVGSIQAKLEARDRKSYKTVDNKIIKYMYLNCS